MNLRERWQRKKKTLFHLLVMSLGVVLLSFTIGKTILSGQQPGLYSFAMINFAGYLFFLLMPVEALVPFYLAEGHAGLTIFILAVLTALLAQLIDYSVGYLASGRIITDLIGEKRYQKTEKRIRKYGLLTVFLFNLFPLSSPLIVLVAGMLRLRLRRVILFSLAGLVLKYIALVYIFGKF